MHLLYVAECYACYLGHIADRESYLKLLPAHRVRSADCRCSQGFGIPFEEKPLLDIETDTCYGDHTGARMALEILGCLTP